MKHVVMGTAGHIDHGKTALVKRLTGMDTDRLKEEKQRGMTIELGFAPLTLPSGNVISIVDVPGHEKFIKSMVAGATGIDFVMLVVAADEGVMPQTQEHIDILSFLNVQKGIVALTKTDLVENEWLQMVKGDILDTLKGTTMEGMPVVPVSSVTGQGIHELIERLEELSQVVSKKKAASLFRLPVDRVFTMTGHGTVITGTVYGGCVSKDQEVSLLPQRVSARVRGIQVHNKSVNSAGAGERCALNLSGINKEVIRRGDVISDSGAITPTRITDAVLYTVKGKKNVVHNQRVHIHTGTKEGLARVKIIGEDKIAGGNKGYIQLKFEEPFTVIRKDRFIIRSFSPVTTIGGGWILFHRTQNRKRFSEESEEAMKIGESGSLEELILYTLNNTEKILSIEDLWKELYVEREEIHRILTTEPVKEDVLWLAEVNKFLSKGLYNNFYKKINETFEQLYKKYPFRYQLDKEEIKSKVFMNIDTKDFAALLNRFVCDELFKIEGNILTQYEPSVVNNILARKETIALENAYLKEGLNINNIQQLGKNLIIDEKKLIDVIQFLKQIGRLVDLGEGLMIHHEVLSSYIQQIRYLLDEQGAATVGQIRDHLGVGRKATIALLEFLDRIEMTRREDDVRKPGNHYRET